MTMLLRNFEDVPVVYPTWYERKVDGHRCIIIVRDGVGVAMSREGHVVAAGSEVADITARLLPDGVYDGELDGGTWSKTQSAVKTNDARALSFRAFDALTLDEWAAGRSEATLAQRKARLANLLNPWRGNARVQPVKGNYAYTGDQLGGAFLAACDSGWEGSVSKDPNAPYLVGKRSGAWQKLKPGRREEW